MSRASIMQAGERYELLPIKGRSTPDDSLLMSKRAPIEGSDSYQDFQQTNLVDCASEPLGTYSRGAASMRSRPNLMSTPIQKSIPLLYSRRQITDLIQAFYTVPTLFIRSWTELMINVQGSYRMTKTLPERFGSFLQVRHSDVRSIGALEPYL